MNQSSGPADQQLSAREAAEYLGFDRKTLEEWERRGVGPIVLRLPSGLPAYSVDHLDEFIEDMRKQAACDRTNGVPRHG